MIKKYKSLGCALLLVSAISPLAQADDANITVAKVYESRSYPVNFGPNQLSVIIGIESETATKARAVRGVATSVVDDTGQQLVSDKKDLDKWSLLREEYRLYPNRAEIGLDLNKPARSAQTLREVSGRFEFYFPGRDAHSLVTVENIGQHAGQTLDDATLKAAGLKLTFLTKDQVEIYKAESDKKADADALKLFPPNAKPDAELEKKRQDLAQKSVEALRQLFGIDVFEGNTLKPNNLALHIEDPNVRLVDIALETAQGQPIKAEGYFGSDNTNIYKFETPIPPDARLKIRVATPQSIVDVPFKLSDVPLP